MFRKWQNIRKCSWLMHLKLSLIALWFKKHVIKLSILILLHYNLFLNAIRLKKYMIKLLIDGVFCIWFSSSLVFDIVQDHWDLRQFILSDFLGPKYFNMLKPKTPQWAKFLDALKLYFTKNAIKHTFIISILSDLDIA